MLRKKDFEAQKAQYGHLATAYDAMQNVMAWNVFYEANGDRAIASVSRMWNEAWGGYIIFDWDTYFAGVMAAVDNKALAYSNAKAITDAITTEGFVPNAEASWGRKTHDRSQPPVGSLCVRLIYDRYKEKDLLEAVYDKLLSWNRWWPQAREQQGFLSWGSNPTELMITPGEKGNTKHSAMLESGLDNSPLFDEAQFDTTTHLLRLASVDLISLYIADCKELAYLAAELGRKEDVQELLKRGEAYGKKLQELWDEQTGIFRDLDLATGEFSTHLAPTNFYPLLAGVATPEQAQRMVKEHLMNPQEFYGEWMLPSISRRDPAFGDNSYWRGRVWAPMNFLVYLGLRQYNLPEAQRLLADRSVALIEKGWLQGGRVFENYNSVTGEGDDVRNSDPFYSWGGLLGLIGLMEYGYWFEEKKWRKEENDTEKCDNFTGMKTKYYQFIEPEPPKAGEPLTPYAVGSSMAIRSLTRRNVADVKSLRHGMDAKAVEVVMGAFDLTQQQMADTLHTNAKTLRKHLKERSPVDPLQGSLVMALAELFQKGVEVFLYKDAFLQ
ncbi:MAG: hypothetical protein HC842_06575 [Cytophagales bacterium]|nr:hypothetical protein [Cytophagales bacterium]